MWWVHCSFIPLLSLASPLQKQLHVLLVFLSECWLCCMVTLDLLDLFCTIDFLGWRCFYLAEEGTFVNLHLWLGVVLVVGFEFLRGLFCLLFISFFLSVSHELFPNCHFNLVMLRIISWHLCCLTEALEISPGHGGHGTYGLDARFDFWLPYLRRSCFSFFSIFIFHVLTGRGQEAGPWECP